MRRRKSDDAQYMLNKSQSSNRNVIHVVVLRTVTVMYVLASAILMTMSILFQPWKQEFLPGSSKFLEFSMWSVCRTTHKGTKCYKGEYDNAPAWFLTFRWFIMIAIIFQYLAVFHMLVKLLRTKNGESRAFWIPSAVSLASSILTLTALLICVGYWEFDFMEETRMYRMGWIMDLENISRAGYPWYMAWFGFAMMLTSSILCLFAHIKDTRYLKTYRMHALPMQGQRAMQSNGF